MLHFQPSSLTMAGKEAKDDSSSWALFPHGKAGSSSWLWAVDKSNTGHTGHLGTKSADKLSPCPTICPSLTLPFKEIYFFKKRQQKHKLMKSLRKIKRLINFTLCNFSYTLDKTSESITDTYSK